MLDMEKNYKLAGYIWSFVKVDKNHAVIQSHGVTALMAWFQNAKIWR